MKFFHHLQVGHRLLFVNHWDVAELSVKEVERVVRCSGDVILIVYDWGPEENRYLVLAYKALLDFLDFFFYSTLV